MRRWIYAAAKLYPAGWRARYGTEFAALLEDCDQDCHSGWREFADVLRGAVNMQMKNAALYWILAGAMAVAGAVAAFAVSLSEPRVYESTAVMRFTPPDSRSPVSKDAFQAQAAYQFNQIERELLSRTTLENVITQPGLDLYPKERNEVPMEDVVIQMRRDLHMNPAGDDSVFSVSFDYPDQPKAQAVVRAMVTKVAEQNLQQTRDQALLWRDIWPHIAPPPGMGTLLIDPPSRARMTNASSFPLIAAGVGLGLLLGLLAATVIRHRKWTLHMAGFAAGCCGLALAASYLVPDRYTSTAVMRITPALVPADPEAGPASPSITGKLQQLEDDVLSETGLENLITTPQLDLYAGQRRIRSLEDVVRMMRKDLTVEPLNSSRTAFRIAFTYSDSDRSKAQAVVRDIVTRFTEENAVKERERARDSGNAKVLEIAEHQFGESLEVVDPPSYPEEPVGTSRLEISIGGFTAGLVVGAWALYFRKRDGAMQPA